MAILNTLLADEFLLYTKTRNFHWNVTGLQFNDLHKFFEAQYEALDDIIDEVAERARALGGRAFGTLEEFREQRPARREARRGPGGAGDAGRRCWPTTRRSSGRCARTSRRSTIGTSDVGTADFLTGLLEKHEKAGLDAEVVPGASTGASGAGAAPGRRSVTACAARTARPSSPTPPSSVWSAAATCAPRRASPRPPATRRKHLAERILTTRAALEGEHKQVTVLFCDIANSTPLAERVGPERMHALLNGFFELALAEVHRYEGTINQFLGDGFMALFGAPLAHEDDARRAVTRGRRHPARAARPRLLRRPGRRRRADGAHRGSTPGLVVVGSIGDNLRMDYTAVGDTTNVAARLQQAAAARRDRHRARRPRGSCAATCACCRPARLDVKGRSEPVIAYKVLGLAPPRSALRARRRARLRPLRRPRRASCGGSASCWPRPRRGAGPAGARGGRGRQRQVAPALRAPPHARRHRADRRSRRAAAPTARAIPYLPILDLVRGAVRRRGASTRRRRWPHKVRATLAELGLDADERAPFLLQLLGIKDDGDALGGPRARGDPRAHDRDAAPDAAARRAAAGRCSWCSRTCTGSTTASEELPRHARRRPRTTRRSSWSPRTGPTGSRPGRRRRVRRRRSCCRRSARSTAARWSRPWSPARGCRSRSCARILEKADGNPLFLEELARAVAEQGDNGARSTVPDTLRAVLGARMDRLPDAHKRLLQTAAVLGREFPQPAAGGGVGRARLGGRAPGRAGAARLRARADRRRRSGLRVQPRAHPGGRLREPAHRAPRQALHEAAAHGLEARRPHGVERASGADRLSLDAHAARRQGGRRRCAGWRRAPWAPTPTPRPSPPCARRRRTPSVSSRTASASLVRLLLERSQAQLPARAGRGGPGGAAGARGVWWSAWAIPRSPRSTTSAWRPRSACSATARCDRARRARAGRGPGAPATLATAGKAHYILARESFWSATSRRGVDHGRQAIVLLERAGERWWLAMAHWSRALSYMLLGQLRRRARLGHLGTDDRATSSAIAALASQAAWTSGWIHATRGDWATGIEAGRRAVGAGARRDEPSAGRGVPGQQSTSRRATPDGGAAAARAGDRGVPAPGLPAARGLVRRCCRPSAHADARRSVERAATLPARAGWRSSTASRSRPPHPRARLVEAQLATARGDLDEAQRAALPRARAGRRASAPVFEAARIHLALAEVGPRPPRSARPARHLGEAHATFTPLKAPIWAARAEALAAAKCA